MPFNRESAQTLLTTVLDKLEASSKKYEDAYILNDMPRELDEELVDIIGWPVMEVLRIREAMQHMMYRVDSLYWPRFLKNQNTRFLSELLVKIASELLARGEQTPFVTEAKFEQLRETISQLIVTTKDQRGDALIQNDLLSAAQLDISVGLLQQFQEHLTELLPSAAVDSDELSVEGTAEQVHQGYDHKQTFDEGTSMERTEYYDENNKLHREDGPAAEYADGYKAWYKHGKLHRKDGPAIEYVDGRKVWYRNGFLVRAERGTL